MQLCSVKTAIVTLGILKLYSLHGIRRKDKKEQFGGLATFPFTLLHHVSTDYIVCTNSVI